MPGLKLKLKPVPFAINPLDQKRASLFCPPWRPIVCGDGFADLTAVLIDLIQTLFSSEMNLDIEKISPQAPSSEMVGQTPLRT